MSEIASLLFHSFFRYHIFNLLEYPFNISSKISKNEVLPSSIILTVTLGILQSDYSICSVILIPSIHAEDSWKYQLFSIPFPPKIYMKITIFTKGI